VDWANAPKLTVRVEHPAAWGFSNPAGTITPVKDIRKGYPFEIEFTPNLAYSLVGWRAYKTSSLPLNWLDSESLDDVNSLDGVSVEVPVLPARGGTGSFTINTTEAVTLVPWCRTEPYVRRTVPANSPTTLYPRGTEIVIYFNAPLKLEANKPLPDLFTSEIIKITADGGKISGNDTCYNYPVYTANPDSGEYKITMTASEVPGEKRIEVTVGPDIFNNTGNKMAKAEVFSFGTSPATGGGSITTWSASYNGNAITVGWTITGTVTVAAHYRVNQGADILLPGEGLTRTISGVSPPNGSGVIEGIGVSNIQEYEVFLDLLVEGVKSNTGSLSFKVWNFPGMSVSNTNPAYEVIDAASALDTTARTVGLANLTLNNTNVKYVLANDIGVSGHTPIGTSTSPFTGKFYGAGRTITVNGINASAQYTGVFGDVNGTNAEIRDLSVYYTGSAGTSAIRAGGIASPPSEKEGPWSLSGCYSRGSLDLRNVNSTANAGGIIGNIDTSSSIRIV